MHDKENKEYSGCLSILLPIWILGQIISVMYNFVYAGFNPENTIVYAYLIGANIIALVGIILLLQFKKIGFYIFIVAFFINLIVGILYPDCVEEHAIAKSVFGLGLFLLLMGIKNKNTKLNGYQTLGIFDSRKISKESLSKEEMIIENEVANSNIKNQDFLDSNINETTIENENENIEVTLEKKDFIDEGTDIKNEELITESPKKAKKISYIVVSSLLIISIIVALFIIIKDNRSNQEIYEDAKMLIEKKDYKEGIKELTKIEDDYVQAKSFLGKLYYYNDSVGINKELGEKLLWEAFEKNDSDACFTLWEIYYEKGNWETLCKIGSKILELDEARGHSLLTFLYYVDEIEGKKNTKKDYKMAESHALKVANNNAEASFYLGQIYIEGGYGVEKNYNKAFYWWNNGAILGDADCYDNLGWCYLNGKGVDRNYKKAFESFKKAISIDSTNEYALYSIAVMFNKGYYVQANRDSLKYYLQKAKEYGSEDALIMYENEF